MIKEFLDGLGIPFNVELPPSYNVAPQSLLPVFRTGECRIASWGHSIPIKGKNKLVINTKVESFNSYAWRDAVANRPAIILANGFYEWHRTGSNKFPHYIYSENSILALAGFWFDDGVTIVTQASSERFSKIHARQPLALSTVEFDFWMGSESNRKELANTTHDHFEWYPVSDFVNNASNDGPQCIEKANI